MTITHTELVKALAKPGQSIIDSLKANEMHLLHMAIGLSGEVAELLDAIIKDDRENVIEELGDIEFYFEGMIQANQTHFDDSGIIITDRVIKMSKVTVDPMPAMLVEAGNLLDLAKRIAIYQDPSHWSKLEGAFKQFRETLDEFYAVTEILVLEAKDGNTKKLTKRYEKMTYSDSAAKARADK